jgi:hypothetical protein
MLTKQLQALYALESQSPETRQHAIMGKSARSRLISVFRYLSTDCEFVIAALGAADPSVEEESPFSIVGRDS